MDDARSLELLKQLAAAGEAANLWQAGEALGLDRGQAEDLGTGLMAQGYLEMVNLSGAVRLTDSGRQALAGQDSPAGGGDDLAGLVAELEEAQAALGLAEKVAADLKADVTALRAQLGRSRPLLPVVRALLAALEQGLESSSQGRARELAARVRALREQ